MAKSSIYFILVLIGFLCCNSCKKAESPVCNTVPDCEAVGKYLVSVSYSIAVGQGSCCDTTYGNRIITITEVSPGVIQFTDSLLPNPQYNVSYDTSQSRPNSPVFISQFNYPGDYGTIYISIWGGDTIGVTKQAHYTASSIAYTNWKGVRVQ